MLNTSSAPSSAGLIGRLATVCVIVASASCDRGADRAANDTGIAPDSPRADTAAAVPVFREWAPAAGRHLLIASGSADSAVVVFPEFTIDSALTDVPFATGGGALAEYELFQPDGRSSSARLTGLTRGARAGCDAWPRGALLSVAGSRPWTIGLSAGHARGISYASLEQVVPRDSANLVIGLTRLASLAPYDTAVAFRGLPYVVRSAYTATLADSQTFVFAELVRRVSIEASPHEERTTIIGERASPGAVFVLAFSERYTGDEESVPTTDLIGLVVLRDGTHAAFAAREYSDGGTYLMFVRGRDASWRLRWQSAYAGC